MLLYLGTLKTKFMFNTTKKLIFLIIFNIMFIRESCFEVEFVKYILTSGNKNFTVV